MKVNAFGKTMIILKDEEYEKLETEVMWLNSICVGTVMWLRSELSCMEHWSNTEKEAFLKSLPETLQRSMNQSEDAYTNVMNVLEGH